MAGLELGQLEAVPQEPASVLPTVEQALYLEQLEQRQRGQLLVIPTADAVVRRWLRTIGEPITRFGEGPYERRERLRTVLASPTLGAALQKVLKDAMAGIGAGEAEDQAADTDEFFVPGREELLLPWRRWLVEYSVPQAQRRIARERQFKGQSIEEAQTRRRQRYQDAAAFSLLASQVGGDRPLSACALSGDQHLVVTGDLGGGCKVWSREDCALVRTLDFHKSRIGNIAFNPDSQSTTLATCDGSGRIALWKLEQPAPVSILSDGVERGHTQRVAQVAFHPSGRLLGSASFDYSWRLWDCERAVEIQLQEGHSRPVYSIAFHPDGGLAATGALDCHTRLWDLRLGRCIWTQSRGHIKAILSIAFHPLLPTMATASEDGTVRLWDLRKLVPLYVLPAHMAPVTSVRWAQGRGVEEEGILLTTASFDGTARIWSGVDYRPLVSLTGHEGKVMAADLIRGDTMVTAGSDHTFKLWGPSVARQG